MDCFYGCSKSRQNQHLLYGTYEVEKAPLPFKEKTVIRCGGILQGIEFNPNESTIWIMRLTVTNAFVRSTQ